MGNQECFQFRQINRLLKAGHNGWLHFLVINRPQRRHHDNRNRVEPRIALLSGGSLVECEQIVIAAWMGNDDPIVVWHVL